MWLTLPTPPSLLIVDDDPTTQPALTRLLRQDGYRLDTVGSAEEAMAKLAQHCYDLVVTKCLRRPQGKMAIVKAASDIVSSPGVVVLSGHGSIRSAVEAMKLGAFDYLTTPCEPETIRLTIQKALDLKRAPTAGRDRCVQLRELSGFNRLVVKSPKMQQVLDIALRVAKTDVAVLLQGETGTGKEGTVQAIHTASRRANRPFITVDCPSLPESLIESELFGHLKGAFTGAIGPKRGLFEEADGGTIFLDEVGELPPTMQVKLLRVLQEQVIAGWGAPPASPLTCGS